MSKDNIDREDAIRAVCSGCLEENNICRHGWDCPMLTNLGKLPSTDRPKVNAELRADFLKRQYESALEEIKRLKADRPQGEWIPATWQDEHCPERLKKHKCSKCGQRAKQILIRTKLVDNHYCNKAEPTIEYTHKEQLSKFCPHCGARMKGVDDEMS